eukprot:scaffold215578_cov29-Tisochrysis_lutea.AAC.3
MGVLSSSGFLSLGFLLWAAVPPWVRRCGCSAGHGPSPGTRVVNLISVDSRGLSSFKLSGVVVPGYAKCLSLAFCVRDLLPLRARCAIGDDVYGVKYFRRRGAPPDPRWMSFRGPPEEFHLRASERAPADFMQQIFNQKNTKQ